MTNDLQISFYHRVWQPIAWPHRHCQPWQHGVHNLAAARASACVTARHTQVSAITDYNCTLSTHRQWQPLLWPRSSQ